MVNYSVNICKNNYKFGFSLQSGRIVHQEHLFYNTFKKGTHKGRPFKPFHLIFNKHLRDDPGYQNEDFHLSLQDAHAHPSKVYQTTTHQPEVV